MDTSERLKRVIDYSGLTASSFSKAIQTKTKQAVYDILQGRTHSISNSVASKIVARFPEISETWLLTGNGDMFRERSSGNISNVHHFSNSILSTGNNSGNIPGSRPTYTSDNLERLKAPIVPRAITKLPDLDVLEYVEERRNDIAKARIFLEDEAVSLWYNVEDNALAPRITQGDMVALMSNQKGMCEIVPGRVYAVDRKSTGINLRIFFKNGDELQAHSINPEYKDFAIPPDDVIRIYRVICMVRFNN